MGNMTNYSKMTKEELQAHLDEINSQIERLENPSRKYAEDSVILKRYNDRVDFSANKPAPSHTRLQVRGENVWRKIKSSDFPSRSEYESYCFEVLMFARRAVERCHKIDMETIVER